MRNKRRKKRKEEAKRQKGEEEAHKKAEEDLAREKEEENVAKNLHNIMSGIDRGEDIIEIDGVENDDKDERSPLKKRGGSSKTTIRRTSGKTHKIISPQDQPQVEKIPSILKATQFMDTYTHPHRRIVLELTIGLTKEDTFDEFAKALASLLSSARIVDPMFVINPIDQFSKDKEIAVKGNISTNMTKLGIHVQISGNVTHSSSRKSGIKMNKERHWQRRRKKFVTQQCTSP